MAPNAYAAIVDGTDGASVQTIEDFDSHHNQLSSTNYLRTRKHIIKGSIILCAVLLFGVVCVSAISNTGYEDDDDDFGVLKMDTNSKVPKEMLATVHGAKYRLRSKKTLAPLGCTVDIMIVRHCERGTIKQHCTSEGFERAEFLSTLFGDDEESRWPAPTALFARPPEHAKQVYREIETLIPLSKKFNLPIHNRGYEVEHKRHLVDDMFKSMASGASCGELFVISWKHENIPKLARQFGCGPDEGCPMSYGSEQFDLVWNMHYIFDQPLFSSRKNGKIGGPEWTITAEVQHENFDILAYQKKKKWMEKNLKEDLPEEVGTGTAFVPH